MQTKIFHRFYIGLFFICALALIGLVACNPQPISKPEIEIVITDKKDLSEAVIKAKMEEPIPLYLIPDSSAPPLPLFVTRQS